MGTPGVPLKYKEDDFADALKKRKGRLVYVAKDMGMHRSTLWEHLKKYPKLQILLKELRDEYIEDGKDLAEDVLMFAMTNKSNDLGRALEATKYFLNNQGKDRGYSHTPTGISYDPSEQITVIISDMKDENGRNRIKLKPIKESEGSDSEA